MDEERDEDVHFRMISDEEADDNVIPAQADELRIEKLSQRMTLISILIPVLIVVILGIAYLDIKRRVIHTEDTGAETAHHLSEDLESRFSSLSLSQAHLQEALDKARDQTNQSLAKAQVNLKKLDEKLDKTHRAMVNQKELQAVSRKLNQNLDNLAQATGEIKAQLDLLSQSLPSRLEQLDQRTTDLSNRLTDLKGAIADIDNNKIDKAALDLALRMEILKTKKAFDVRLEELRDQIQSLKQRSPERTQKRSAPSRTPTVSKTPQAKETPAPSDDGKLQEQTIR
jgi:DNA repair exonuclease SbcCD ATPase subunit